MKIPSYNELQLVISLEGALKLLKETDQARIYQQSIEFYEDAIAQYRSKYSEFLNQPKKVG